VVVNESKTLEFSYVSTFLAAALDARRVQLGLIPFYFFQSEILYLANCSSLYPIFFDASCVTPNTHRPRKPLGLFGALFGRLETTRSSFRYRLYVFYFLRIYKRTTQLSYSGGTRLHPKRVSLTVGTRRLSPLYGIITNLFTDAFLFDFIIMAVDPDCYNVTPDTQSCYPTTDSVIYQNQWTRVVCEFSTLLSYSTSFMLIHFSQGIPVTRSLLETMVMAR